MKIFKQKLLVQHQSPLKDASKHVRKSHKIEEAILLYHESLRSSHQENKVVNQFQCIHFCDELQRTVHTTEVLHDR